VPIRAPLLYDFSPVIRGYFAGFRGKARPIAGMCRNRLLLIVMYQTVILGFLKCVIVLFDP